MFVQLKSIAGSFGKSAIVYQFIGSDFSLISRYSSYEIVLPPIEIRWSVGFVKNGCFFGDSMFSKESNTSKLALIYLAGYMQEQGGRFIDCQLPTDHLISMGGKTISYDEYLEISEKSEPINW